MDLLVWLIFICLNIAMYGGIMVVCLLMVAFFRSKSRRRADEIIAAGDESEKNINRVISCLKIMRFRHSEPAEEDKARIEKLCIIRDNILKIKTKMNVNE